MNVMVNGRGTPDRSERMRARVEVFKPENTRFDLEGQRVDLKTFRVTNLENPTPTTPGLMETGKASEVMEQHRDRKDFVHQLFGKDLVKIPYTLLHADQKGLFGDFSSPEGQDLFADADMVIEDGENSLPEWATDLHRFAELKLGRRFTLDEKLTALRGLERRGKSMRFTVGMSRYSQAFFSMGSEGVRLELTDEDRQRLKESGFDSSHLDELEGLTELLQGTHGARTIREVIQKETGGLPDFNQRVHHYLLGVAGTVLTRDGDVVFVNRGAGVSVNRGINVTASGGVKFKKEYLARHGLQRHLGRQMHEEAREEIGLKSGDLLLGAMQERIALELGVGESEYDLVPVGMARELPRGGSPEVMFMIQFRGDTQDLVNRIAGNTHEDRSEIDSLVYAYPMEEVRKLLKQSDAERVVQHKGLLNLMMMDRYLSQ